MKSSDPDADARSLRMIMRLTDARIRLNRCIKLTTHGIQAFRWVMGTQFSTTSWITEICVKAGCQKKKLTDRHKLARFGLCAQRLTRYAYQGDPFLYCIVKVTKHEFNL